MTHDSKDICEVCGRPLGDQLIEGHHLIPKTFKGKIKYPIHKVCHRHIHAFISERELSKYYHTFERIREHPQMQKFIQWVQAKPLDFYISCDESTDRKDKRHRK